NGYWILGDSNSLILDLGDDGEPLWIYKVWRNYSYAGDVPIISLDTAIDKLDRRELLHSDWHPEAGDITIDDISLGYYTEKHSNNDTILEPVWMFYGSNATTGARLGFYVYARQFANFSAEPVSGEVPLNVTFTDQSDTSPGKWLWDFGDGTNSTLCNPIHSYQKTGNFTVTLIVWNDLGSDTTSKKSFITVLPSRTMALDPALTRAVNSTEKSERSR
ncbi:MAG: PKD domain-containing protein, partial [Methanoregula sp.]|nr:PKD domain-containing protein [Methanoregula sp.]